MPADAPIPRAEHPRPDRRRSRWRTLNGQWDCALLPSLDPALAPHDVAFDRAITVPFAFQAEASGIGTTEPFEVVWYRRRFTPPERAAHERVLLHFGAVDFAATVWVDGAEVGSHRGGHTSFTLDITDALGAGDGNEAAEHEIVVRAHDEFRADQLRGKQTASFPFMIHYTPTSGIWQPVWLEIAGAAWIREVHVQAAADGSLVVTPDLGGSAASAGEPITTRVEVATGAGPFVASGATHSISTTVPGVRPWSPDDPACYDLTVSLCAADGTVLDTVHGHVGFRTLRIDGDEWLLNGEPLRQRLLLDQGYWPESLLTPPSDAAMLADLQFVKDIGCNGVRKHQKIEDPRWLWHADRLGVLVWEELPSPFGLTRFGGALLDDALAEWREAIVRDRSHPCIVAWVPINESWGVQGLHARPEYRDAVRRFVAATRALDATRAVVDNSGWGHVDTDVVDVHDYDQRPDAVQARWTGIEARGWDRGTMEVEGMDFDLARWLDFVGVTDVGAVDADRLMEMVPDVRIWAEGCVPPPGTAGPLVLSELGGVGLDTGAAVADRYDYVGATDAADLAARLGALLAAVEAVPEMRGWCWTQLADTEQEINGLLTADRRPKVDPAVLRQIIDGLPWSARR